MSTIPGFVGLVAKCHSLAVREIDRPSLTRAEAFREERRGDSRVQMRRRRMRRVRGVRRFVIDRKRNEMKEGTTFQDEASLPPHSHTHTHTHTHTHKRLYFIINENAISQDRREGERLMRY